MLHNFAPLQDGRSDEIGLCQYQQILWAEKIPEKNTAQLLQEINANLRFLNSPTFQEKKGRIF